jgi:hypothetical protein
MYSQQAERLSTSSNSYAQSETSGESEMGGRQTLTPGGRMHWFQSFSKSATTLTRGSFWSAALQNLMLLSVDE